MVHSLLSLEVNERLLGLGGIQTEGVEGEFIQMVEGIIYRVRRAD